MFQAREPALLPNGVMVFPARPEGGWCWSKVDDTRDSGRVGGQVSGRRSTCELSGHRDHTASLGQRERLGWHVGLHLGGLEQGVAGRGSPGRF